MSKSAIVAIIVVIVVLAGGGAYLVMHNSNNDKKTTTTTTNTTPSTMNTEQMPNSGTPDSQQSTSNTVTIDNFAFSPANITVKVGTTVTWTNKDSTTHTVSETDGKKGPDSGNLASGKSYSFTYTSTGAFNYHCGIHPSMTGTVTVTE